MKALQRKQFDQAAQTTSGVMVTERNWAAIIQILREQYRSLNQISTQMASLASQQSLDEALWQQTENLSSNLSVLEQTAEQFQQTAEASIGQMTKALTATLTSLEQQAGNLNGKFTSALSEEQIRMKRLSGRLIWVSLIPTAVLLISELVPHIWPLI